MSLGHCIMTFGTDARSGRRWEGAELLSAHDYAVIGTLLSELRHRHLPDDIRPDLHQDAEQRYVMLQDTQLDTTALHPIHHGSRKHWFNHHINCGGIINRLCTETLKIPWEDALILFEGLYLNWDPKKFQQSIEFHG